MKPIFKTIFGSHLYGCNVPTSDLDYKGVALPSSEEILLGVIPKTESFDTKEDKSAKNTKDDIDSQFFSLKKFLYDLQSGQNYCYELLFAPKEYWRIEPNKIWLDLLANRDKLISKNATALVGYARAQAYKYRRKR